MGAHPPPPQRHKWLRAGADIALAIGLLVIDAVAALIAFVFGLDTVGYTLFDPGADNSPLSLVRPLTYVAAVGGIVLVSAILLFRARVVISSGVQAFAGLALVSAAVIGINHAEREARPQPAPTERGPGSLCRSGGDSSECLGG
ncbi:hypothetical protein GCM10010387_02170 [Streptomyces inusitatus]|uniref:DUF6234 domain-containing protein n=1 Tax=Streptomyces inusitatus TaxID=68221 RepID=A0A918PKY4_9ACTN|nr:hypothetical protein GCM10010387_02170 [Streptomyces inusitatus]